MKSKSLIIFVAVGLFLTNCGDNNAATNEAQQTNNLLPEKKAEQPVNSSAQGDGIIGQWEMVGSVMDTNDNLQIDEAERKNLKATMKDYMKLNSDGSGVFNIDKKEGRYELKDQENGKKYLTWYDKANGRHRIGTIIKVTKSELHIKEPGGSGLFVWKRL